MAGTIIVSLVMVSCCSCHDDGIDCCSCLMMSRTFVVSMVITVCHSCYGDVADICNSYLPLSVSLPVHLSRLKLGRFLNHQ